MIPKRAIFFWEGLEMSWLRRQTLETFRLCNPDWDVVLINGDGLPIKKNGLLSIVHRSDWARYRELHANGGFYFDTDIAFCAPIPDEWVNSDLVLPVPAENGNVGNIAMLGCKPGEPFFADACSLCRDAVASIQYLNYQDLGVVALSKAKYFLAGRDVLWVDDDAMIPVPWNQVHRLWNAHHGPIPPLTIGVHWFGGDHLSMSVDSEADEEWLGNSRSIVAKAIKCARKQ